MRAVAYRVQADDGRGPWRPGFSHTWIEGDAPAGRLTETLMDLLPLSTLRALPLGMTYGSACRTVEALGRWFTACERRRLAQLGFYPVRVNADVVLAESEWQLFIGRRKPFNQGATRLRWDRMGVTA